MPFAVQFLQLPAVVLVERMRARRAICCLGRGHRPLVPAGRRGGAVPRARPPGSVLIVCVAMYQAMAAVAGCAWNSWMRDLVPGELTIGRFFGRRAAATTALATVLALLGGVADRWLEARMPRAIRLIAYSALFVASAAIGFLGSGCCRSRRSSRCRRSPSTRASSHC